MHWLTPSTWSEPTCSLPIAVTSALLRALRCLAELDLDGTTGRMFASTRFTFPHINAAAAHCKITLPASCRDHATHLFRTWQSRITCTLSAYLGSRFARFAEDQAFVPGPYPDLLSDIQAVS